MAIASPAANWVPLTKLPAGHLQPAMPIAFNVVSQLFARFQFAGKQDSWHLIDDYIRVALLVASDQNQVVLQGSRLDGLLPVTRSNRAARVNPNLQKMIGLIRRLIVFAVSDSRSG